MKENNSIKKIISFITFSYLIILVLVAIVNDSSNFGYLSQLSEPYKGYYTGLFIVEIIWCIVIFFCSIIAVTYLFKKEFDDLLNINITISFLFALILNVSIAITMGFTKEIASNYSSYVQFSFSGQVISMLVFSIFAMIFLVISFFVNKEYYLGIKKTLIIIGNIFSIIVLIISLVSTSSSSTSLTSSGVLYFSSVSQLLIIILLSLITGLINDVDYSIRKKTNNNAYYKRCRKCGKIIYSNDDYCPDCLKRIQEDNLREDKINEIKNKNYSNESNNHNHINKESSSVEIKGKKDIIDPASELKKLKNLLDEGIITSEEYEEKRKKYVDQL